MIDDDDKTLLINYTFKINLVRLIGRSILPASLKVTVEVENNDESTDEELTEVLEKISYWFDNIVSRCVVFAGHNEDAISMFFGEDGVNKSNNIIMLTPDDPSDDQLAVLFQAKLNALSNGHMEFGVIEIDSENHIGLSFTFLGNSDDHLPKIDEWIGLEYYFDEPWWNRDDASTIDIPPQPGTDLTKSPPWAYSLDFLRGKQEPVVLKPDFKPKVIDGGKK